MYFPLYSDSKGIFINKESYRKEIFIIQAIDYYAVYLYSGFNKQLLSNELQGAESI